MRRLPHAAVQVWALPWGLHGDGASAAQELARYVPLPGTSTSISVQQGSDTSLGAGLT